MMDDKLYETIEVCTFRRKIHNVVEIIATYGDGTSERIWTFNEKRQYFDSTEFVGKTKIEAIFMCDRRSRRTNQSLL